jgi:alpha,alpha-trehalase
VKASVHGQADPPREVLVLSSEELERKRPVVMLKVASPLGLYAEEFDVDTGRHLGNFPQAFSHLAAVEAAARIVLADRLGELSG